MDIVADAVAALKELKANKARIDQDFPFLAPFTPFIGIALHAVHTVQKSGEEDSVANAVHAVASTLTPGMGSSDTLTGDTTAPNTAITGDHIEAAADAISGDQDSTAALNAIPDIPTTPDASA